VSNSADSPQVIAASKSLEPLQVTGITTVTIGTVVWAIATLVLLALHNKLEASGRGDWPQIAAAGTFLGLLGMRFAKRRAARTLRAQTSQQDTSR